MINRSLPGLFPLNEKKLFRRALRAAAFNFPGVKREVVIDCVRRVSKGIVSRLPKVAREAVLEQVCDDVGRFEMISRLAPDCNVVALRVSGMYGVIQSASDDRAVLMQYAKTGTWAERTNDLVTSFFADKAGSYIDIGANIGLTTIPVAQNPRVRCLAIEPEPRNFANLRANVAENCRHNNVELRCLALYTKRQKLSFELSSGNLGDHRLRIGDKIGRIGEENRSTIEVDAVPLDEIAGSLNGPLAVKIDTQGAEPFVVSGGKKTLSRADLVISEFWPYGMVRLGGDPEELIKFFRDQFSTLAIEMEESLVWSKSQCSEAGTVLSPRSSAAVCDQLSALVAAHSDNPEMYLDVIARR
jgi:FkbM family methyltransferase